jgi:hypothetical protein
METKERANGVEVELLLAHHPHGNYGAAGSLRRAVMVLPWKLAITLRNPKRKV